MISNIKVRLDDVIGVINPNIYGSQIEKGLVGSVEGGVWVGSDSKIPNIDGIRKDVVEALKRINLPLIRMGGCFAELYHWEDGIGLQNERPRRINFWRQEKESNNLEESNEFGTDEFIRFCRLVGADSYICVNVSTGTPREAFSWVEYCNYEGDTHYTQLRAKNGTRHPHNVKYWEIGNENWSCGGLMEPEQYAREYRKIAYNIRKYSSIPIKLSACGGHRNWNSIFLQALSRFRHTPHDWPYFIDALVIHKGIGMGIDTGGDIKFTDQQHYNIFGQLLQLDNEFTRTIDTLNYYTRGIKDIKIHVNEWVVHHPQAPPFQKNTLRTALAAACVLNLFNKYAHKVTQASAQLANFAMCLVRTRNQEMFRTPYYHVADLYQHHMGNEALQIKVESPPFNTIVRGQSPLGVRSGTQTLQSLDVSASLRRSDKRLVVTMVNRHLTKNIETRIRIEGGDELDGGKVRMLKADDIHAYNTFENPNRVHPSDWMEIEAKGKAFTYTAPKHSVNELILELG